jgi:hypothetical protein
MARPEPVAQRGRGCHQRNMQSLAVFDRLRHFSTVAPPKTRSSGDVRRLRRGSSLEPRWSVWFQEPVVVLVAATRQPKSHCAESCSRVRPRKWSSTGFWRSIAQTSMRLPMRFNANLQRGSRGTALPERWRRRYARCGRQRICLASPRASNDLRNAADNTLSGDGLLRAPFGAGLESVPGTKPCAWRLSLPCYPVMPSNPCSALPFPPTKRVRRCRSARATSVTRRASVSTTPGRTGRRWSSEVGDGPSARVRLFDSSGRSRTRSLPLA